MNWSNIYVILHLNPDDIHNGNIVGYIALDVPQDRPITGSDMVPVKVQSLNDDGSASVLLGDRCVSGTEPLGWYESYHAKWFTDGDKTYVAVGKGVSWLS